MEVFNCFFCILGQRSFRSPREKIFWGMAEIEERSLLRVHISCLRRSPSCRQFRPLVSLGWPQGRGIPIPGFGLPVIAVGRHLSRQLLEVELDSICRRAQRLHTSAKASF